MNSLWCTFSQCFQASWIFSMYIWSSALQHLCHSTCFALLDLYHLMCCMQNANNYILLHCTYVASLFISFLNAMCSFMMIVCTFQLRNLSKKIYGLSYTVELFLKAVDLFYSSFQLNNNSDNISKSVRSCNCHNNKTYVTLNLYSYNSELIWWLVWIGVDCCGFQYGIYYLCFLPNN